MGSSRCQKKLKSLEETAELLGTYPVTLENNLQGTLNPSRNTHQTDMWRSEREGSGTVKVTVINLNAETILDKLELQGTDKLSVLIDEVKQASVDAHESIVELIVDGIQLRKDSSIEESGLKDGSTVTAILKKAVPTVLRNEHGDTAELKADGTVECTGPPGGTIHAGGICAIQDQLVDVRRMYLAEYYTVFFGARCFLFAALKSDGSLVVWGRDVVAFSIHVAAFMRPTLHTAA